MSQRKSAKNVNYTHHYRIKQKNLHRTISTRPDLQIPTSKQHILEFLNTHNLHFNWKKQTLKIDLLWILQQPLLSNYTFQSNKYQAQTNSLSTSPRFDERSKLETGNSKMSKPIPLSNHGSTFQARNAKLGKYIWISNSEYRSKSRKPRTRWRPSPISNVGSSAIQNRPDLIDSNANVEVFFLTKKK